MSYGTPVGNAGSSYVVVMTYNVIDVKVNLTVSFEVSTEAQRDAIFQGFLTILSGINGATINSAKKLGTYYQAVTP